VAARGRAGRPSFGWLAFSGVVTLIAAVLGAGFLLHGAQGALAGAGMAGEPGIVTVTTCSSSRFGESCSGTFTPSDRPLPMPSTVSVDGANRPGEMIGRVRLVDGTAWPSEPGDVGSWSVDLVFGVLLAVIAVGSAVSQGRTTWRWLHAASDDRVRLG
jgi:hypothetical protein